MSQAIRNALREIEDEIAKHNKARESLLALLGETVPSNYGVSEIAGPIGGGDEDKLTNREKVVNAMRMLSRPAKPKDIFKYTKDIAGMNSLHATLSKHKGEFFIHNESDGTWALKPKDTATLGKA